MRKNDDLPWAMRDHALFIAFAPVQRRAMPSPSSSSMAAAGAKVAGPIARDILLECQQRDPRARPLGAPARRRQAREQETMAYSSFSSLGATSI